MKKTFSHNRLNYRVAIIIPTLNEETFISDCLDSVIGQSFPIDQMEVLVIDGGSSDNTQSIVLEYHKQYSNINLYNNPAKIQSVAFNIGLDKSSAPYIIRLDAHATYNKDYIKYCLQDLYTIEGIGNVGGVCDIKPQNNTLTAEANAILNKLRFGIGGAAFRIGNVAGEVDTVPFGAFPREILTEVGGMREDLPRGEDNEINSRIRKKGYKIYLDPRIISTYYARKTVKESVKQMYNNGVSIGMLLHIDKKAVSIRHLIPMLFVMSLLVSAMVALICFDLWWIFAFIIGVYLLAALIADINACNTYGFKYFFILPLLFLSIHSAYGYGTIIGLFKH